jgi:hypothetical protein
MNRVFLGRTIRVKPSTENRHIFAEYGLVRVEKGDPEICRLCHCHIYPDDTPSCYAIKKAGRLTADPEALFHTTCLEEFAKNRAGLWEIVDPGVEVDPNTGLEII